MRAGLLTDSITIRRATTITNQYGEREENWNDVYTTKARIVWKDGTLTIENGEIRHNNTKTVEVWKYVPVQETDVIVWKDKKHRITSINEDKHQQKKVLQIEEINE